MGAPSTAHEDRVGTLRSLAVLSGFTVEVKLSSEEIPDLVLVDPSSGGLLIADAKESEGPSDLATRHRLERYVRASRRWRKVGLDVVLAVCHGSVMSSGLWLDTLFAVAHRADLDVAEAGSRQLSSHEVVAWVALKYSAEEVQLASA